MFRIIVVRNVVGWRSSILHVFFLLLCVFGFCGVYHFSSCFQWQKDVHKRMFLILNQRFVITRLFLGVNWRPKLPNAPMQSLPINPCLECPLVRILLHVVVVIAPYPLQFLEENTQAKPGRCPTVKPTDTCASKCDSDNDCSGKAKCCEIGCGKTCREPAEEQLGM